MTTRRVVFVVLALLVAGCGWLTPSGPSPSDAVTYQVIGTAVTGSALITYTSPSSVVQVTANINSPWQSGVIAGYGQFIDQRASITVTAFGCATAQVLVNAKVEAERAGCGQPITVTAQK